MRGVVAARSWRCRAGTTRRGTWLGVGGEGLGGVGGGVGERSFLSHMLGGRGGRSMNSGHGVWGEEWGGGRREGGKEWE